MSRITQRITQPISKRILVVCPHPENVAPGQRLKYEQYFGHWRAHGYEVVVSPFMSRRFQRIVYQPGRLLEKVFWDALGLPQAHTRSAAGTVL